MTPPRRVPQVFRPGFSDPGLHRLNQGAPGLDFQTWDTPSTPDKANHTTRVPQVPDFQTWDSPSTPDEADSKTRVPPVWIFRPGISPTPARIRMPILSIETRQIRSPIAYNYHPIRHNATNGEISRCVQPAPTREPTPQQPCSYQEIGGNFPHPRTEPFFPSLTPHRPSIDRATGSPVHTPPEHIPPPCFG